MRISFGHCEGGRLPFCPPFLREGRGDVRLFERLALLALPLAFINPLRGLGISICLFYNTTGYPCPGCGLTRSLSRLLHLDPIGSLAYHPLGMPIALALFFFALGGLWPRLDEWIHRRRTLITRLFLGGGIVLIVFGVIRLVLLWLGFSLPGGVFN